MKCLIREVSSNRRRNAGKSKAKKTDEIPEAAL